MWRRTAQLHRSSLLVSTRPCFEGNHRRHCRLGPNTGWRPVRPRIETTTSVVPLEALQAEKGTHTGVDPIIPVERVRSDMDDQFASTRDLGDVLEEVARRGMRLFARAGHSRSDYLCALDVMSALIKRRRGTPMALTARPTSGRRYPSPLPRPGPQGVDGRSASNQDRVPALHALQAYCLGAAHRMMASICNSCVMGSDELSTENERRSSVGRHMGAEPFGRHPPVWTEDTTSEVPVSLDGISGHGREGRAVAADAIRGILPGGERAGS